jgi:hypothetical protein
VRQEEAGTRRQLVEEEQLLVLQEQQAKQKIILGKNVSVSWRTGFILLESTK